MPEQGQPASAWVSADPAYNAYAQQPQGWGAGGEHLETQPVGQWPEGHTSPSQGGQPWTQPTGDVPREGAWQWEQPVDPLSEGAGQQSPTPEPSGSSPAEPPTGPAVVPPVKTPEPGGSTAADRVVPPDGDDPGGSVVTSSQEPPPQQRRAWWQGPER